MVNWLFMYWKKKIWMFSFSNFDGGLFNCNRAPPSRDIITASLEKVYGLWVAHFIFFRFEIWIRIRIFFQKTFFRKLHFFQNKLFYSFYVLIYSERGCSAPIADFRPIHVREPHLKFCNFFVWKLSTRPYSVWFQINRKMMNTIWFRFGLMSITKFKHIEISSGRYTCPIPYGQRYNCTGTGISVPMPYGLAKLILSPPILDCHPCELPSLWIAIFSKIFRLGSDIIGSYEYILFNIGAILQWPSLYMHIAP